MIKCSWMLAGLLLLGGSTVVAPLAAQDARPTRTIQRTSDKPNALPEQARQVREQVQERNSRALADFRNRTRGDNDRGRNNPDRDRGNNRGGGRDHRDHGRHHDHHGHWHNGHVHHRPVYYRPVYHRPVIVPVYPSYRTTEVIYTLPSGSLTLSVSGTTHYYSRGTFYRPGSRGYMVTHLAPGTIISTMPGGTRTVWYQGYSTPFYYDGWTYYQASSSGYRIVEPPSTELIDRPTDVATERARAALASQASYSDGAPEVAKVPAPKVQTVEYLPVGYTQIFIEGEVFYEHDGVFYRWDPGREAYLVIEDPRVEDA